MNKHVRVWSLQEAKAKFSEVVRLAQSEGPQLVTIHGKSAVTISAIPQKSDLIAGKYQPTGTGLDLVRAIQACPEPGFLEEFDNLRVREPVVLKDVDFE